MAAEKTFKYIMSSNCQVYFVKFREVIATEVFIVMVGVKLYHCMWSRCQLVISVGVLHLRESLFIFRVYCMIESIIKLLDLSTDSFLHDINS